MSVVIACPKCQKNLKVEEHVLGKNIKCPACAAVFASEAPVVAVPATVPGAYEDEDEVRPRKAGVRGARDDEDERPRRVAGKRRRDEDDEDDRSRRGSRKKEKKSAGGTVALVLGAVVLLLCGGCGLGGYYVWVKINEGAHEFAAAMTGVQAQLTTDLQTRPASPRGPTETTKEAPPNTGRAGGTKPVTQPLVLAAQQMAQDIYDKGGLPRNDLEVEGVVYDLDTTADLSVSEVIFRLLVKDAKTSALKPYTIYCRFPRPVPAGDKVATDVAVGRTVTMRGQMTGWGNDSATLNDCVLVASKPPGPAEPPTVVTAEQLIQDLAKDSEAFARYARKPLQVEGVVKKPSGSLDSFVREVQFEVPVMDPKTGQRQDVPVYCRLATPRPANRADDVAVGKKITVRGQLTDWKTGDFAAARLSACVLGGAESSKPGKPPKPRRPPTPDNPSKPDEQLVVLKAEEFGKDLYEGEREAFNRYFRKPLQVEGVVYQQTAGAGDSVAEIAFESQVKDKKTGLMKPFLIHCKFSNPFPAGDKVAGLAVGKTVTVRGKLGGVSYIDRKATLNECVLVDPGPSP